jgi:hypothetical protein
VKGGDSSGPGDPHHVNAVQLTKAAWVRPHFGAGGLHEVATERRHLGSEKRTPFTRPPRNRSWRPPSHGMEPLARASPRPGRGGGDRGARGGWWVALGGRQRHRVAIARSHRSGNRAVKRGSPQSRSHRAAPSFPVLSPRVFGRGERGAKGTDVSRGRARAARSGRRATPVSRRKAYRGIQGSLHWESAKYGCSSLKCFGVQRSIGRIAGRDARGRYQAHLGHARPSSKETAGGAVTRISGGGIRANTVRGPRRSLLTTETKRGAHVARASLVGIASGGVRARGLGKS